ncbi:energy-converting hydrogenase A subunit F [Methanomicrobium sp. W14]|uniref:EhaF family protein n=1 Tax=Methanomicrobium sp. W14 TaxID=2817839 RepID=UPI001AE6AF82|nr:EhaF family protein [Methanomicrobium sp. W14]MBP2132344.1 energy-converting hydrogenase A subunit F [Methanomicrobium sp. W14]
MSIIRKVSKILQNQNNLVRVYSILVIIVVLIGIAALPSVSYDNNQLYPKSIDINNPLNPYDRGGQPFEKTEVKAQYPQNSEYLGYVTAYLTPLSLFIAQNTLYAGTTIVSHPGGIIDEILYYTRGLDTIVETSILFTAFAIAMFLFRRHE